MSRSLGILPECAVQCLRVCTVDEQACGTATMLHEICTFWLAVRVPSLAKG